MLDDSWQVISSSCISSVVAVVGVVVRKGERDGREVVVMGEAEVELCLLLRLSTTTQAMASILGEGGGNTSWLVLLCGVLVNLVVTLPTTGVRLGQELLCDRDDPGRDDSEGGST